MIKAIEILIQNGVMTKYNYLISYDNKTCYLDDRKCTISDETLDEIKSILLHWKNEYGENNVIDAEEFNITVYTEEKTEKYHGKGIYPSNYEALKKVLGDING